MLKKITVLVIHTLRDYMIYVFGTKIKQPRKSHIKKDPEAQADFLILTKPNF